MELFAPYQDRLDILANNINSVVCHCPICEDSEESDSIRRTLIQLEFYGDYNDTEMAEEQLKLCHEEGMHSGILYLMSLKVVMCFYLQALFFDDSTPLSYYLKFSY